MLKKEVQMLCDEIKDHRYSLDCQLKISSALTLGKVYHFLETGSDDDKKLLSFTLNKVKKKMKSNLIQSIWDAAVSKSKHNFKKDNGYLIPINALKKAMISDMFYLKHIDTQSVIDLGSNPKWHRFSMIGLIRKHLAANDMDDPFSESKFNYDILDQDGAKEGSNVLNPLIKQCDSIPIDDMVELGMNDEELAKLILFDFGGTLAYFQISSQFVEHHESMRSDIAQFWRNYISLNPLNAEFEAVIKQKLEEFKQTYPEFRNINLRSRPSRYARPRPVPNNNPQQDNDQDAFLRFILGVGLASAFAGGYIVGTGVTLGAVTAMNSTVVFGLGCAATGYAAAKWGPDVYSKAKVWVNL